MLCVGYPNGSLRGLHSHRRHSRGSTTASTRSSGPRSRRRSAWRRPGGSPRSSGASRGGIQVNQDFIDLLRALCDAEARFLIVGAYAVSFHAEPRATGDLDLWVEPSAANAPRVHAALAGLRRTAPRADRRRSGHPGGGVPDGAAAAADRRDDVNHRRRGSRPPGRTASPPRMAASRSRSSGGRPCWSTSGPSHGRATSSTSSSSSATRRRNPESAVRPSRRHDPLLDHRPRGVDDALAAPDAWSIRARAGPWRQLTSSFRPTKVSARFTALSKQAMIHITQYGSGRSAPDSRAG